MMCDWWGSLVDSLIHQNHHHSDTNFRSFLCPFIGQILTSSFWGRPLLDVGTSIVNTTDLPHAAGCKDREDAST
jgi:hypothetical protein